MSRTHHHITKYLHWRLALLVLVGVSALQTTQAQSNPVRVTVEPDTILIGEQINYRIEIQIDTTDVVFFPTGQSFLPLEVIDTPAIDTSFEGRTARLIKLYGLSAYDSGNYTIPTQQITVNRMPMYTDSFRIRVQHVAVDTTLQGLYDIKDVQRARPAGSPFWDFLPYLLLLVLAAFIGLWYYLVRSRSGLNLFRRAWEQLTPIERAGHLLNELGQSRLLLENKAKAYYTRLTDILRTYLEERLGIPASERTTAQLLDLLELYRREEEDGREFSFTPDQIQRLSEVLERSDLVKFAQWNPGPGQGEKDLTAIHALLDELEQAFRDVTREDRLEEHEVNRELDMLAKRRKFLFNRITPAAGVLLLGLIVAWQLGWLVPGDLKEGLTLSEKEWVRSTYGFPPVTLEAPDVLIRQRDLVAREPDTTVIRENHFEYHLRGGLFSIDIKSAELSDRKSDPPLTSILEERFVEMEENNQTRNLITKEEKFQSANGVMGIKVYGSGEFQTQRSREYVKGHYAIIAFGGPGFYQLVHLTWRLDDPLSQQVADRVLNSIEVSTEL